MSAGPAYVLDASAFLAMIHLEAGAEVVEAIIDGSVISAVNWCEVHERAEAGGVDVTGLRADMQTRGIEIAPFVVEDAELAATFRNSSRHLGLSLADRACLALAVRLGRPALTADRAWLDLDFDVEVHAIR